MMVIVWISEDGEVYSAKRLMGAKGTLHLAVESLGETGWDWHVWDTAGCVRQHYGLADTLEEAKAKAERALLDIIEQFTRVA